MFEIAESVGNDVSASYQDFLMQDASIDYHGSTPDLGIGFGSESLEASPEVAEAEPMTGEVLMPDADAAEPVANIEALPQIIEADYAPIEEQEALPAPESEIDTTPEPDMGGDMDEPSF